MWITTPYSVDNPVDNSFYSRAFTTPEYVHLPPPNFKIYVHLPPLKYVHLPPQPIYNTYNTFTYKF